MRVPGKGIDAPGLEGTGGCDLLVGDEAGFHAQRLRATCRVEIHCNTTVYTGSEKETDNSTAASKTPQICQKPSPQSPSTAQSSIRARQGNAQQIQSCLFPGFLALSYSLAHSASCCRNEWMSHSPAQSSPEIQKALAGSREGCGKSNAKISPAKSTDGTTPTQQQDRTQTPTTSHSHTDTRVPLSSQGCAAGQECRRHRERAQADDPLHSPEDFDPLLLFKLPSRKSSGFTAQTGKGHSKSS